MSMIAKSDVMRIAGAAVGDSRITKVASGTAEPSVRAYVSLEVERFTN